MHNKGHTVFTDGILAQTEISQHQMDCRENPYIHGREDETYRLW